MQRRSTAFRAFVSAALLTGCADLTKQDEITVVPDRAAPAAQPQGGAAAPADVQARAEGAAPAGARRSVIPAQVDPPAAAAPRAGGACGE